MLTQQQKSIARDLYRRSLRIERITNGTTTVFDHDQHAAYMRAVDDEGQAAGVSQECWHTFCTLAGAIHEGVAG